MSESSPTTVRVFVNGKGVDVPAKGTVLDAVRAWDAAAAEELLSGQRALSDSRGLPAAPSDPIHGGAIFRLVSGRKAANDSTLDSDE